MKKYDDIKTKMIRYKARSYSSLVLGLIYLGWSYYFIEPIEHHETYQLILDDPFFREEVPNAIRTQQKNAEYIISGHADYPPVCHPNSPIARLVEFNGKVVGIGISIFPVGVYHLIEDSWDNFPFNVHMDPFSVKYIDKVYETFFNKIVVFFQLCKKDTRHLSDKYKSPVGPEVRCPVGPMSFCNV